MAKITNQSKILFEELLKCPRKNSDLNPIEML